MRLTLAFCLFCYVLFMMHSTALRWKQMHMASGGRGLVLRYDSCDMQSETLGGAL